MGFICLFVYLPFRAVYNPLRVFIGTKHFIIHFSQFSYFKLRSMHVLNFM